MATSSMPISNADVRKSENPHSKKSVAKEGAIKFKQNFVERKRSNSHGGGSQSSSRSNLIRPSISKIVRNIQNVKFYDARFSRRDQLRKVLPSVPTRKILCESDYSSENSVKLVCRIHPTTQFAKDKIEISDSGQVKLYNTKIGRRTKEDSHSIESLGQEEKFEGSA